MSLFTSNSKRSFFVKSSLCILILSIGYSLALSSFDKIERRSLSQSQENSLKVEKYLLEDVPLTAVVGSSISAELKLGENTSNIAFGGDSAISGLALILESGKFPKIVLIELNVLLSKSETILDGSRNWLYKLEFPFKNVFYEKSNPVLLLMSLIRKQPKKEQINQAAFDVGFESQRKGNTVVTPRDLDLYKEHLNEVASLVDMLKSKGVTVKYFWAPADPRIYDSVRQKALRAEAEILFRNDILSAFESEQIFPAEITTTDGIHLTTDSLDKWAQVLHKNFVY